MRFLSFLLAVVVLGAVSCLTSSDLERRYPYDSCPDACPANADGTCICDDLENCPPGETCCPEGSEPNEAGECVAGSVNNQEMNHTDPNGMENNTTDCVDGESVCCEDNAPECCHNDNPYGCCKNADGVWARCSENSEGRLASGVAIVFLDVTDGCEPNEDQLPGADFYGMRAWVGDEEVELAVLTVGNVEGEMDPSAANLAQELVEQSEEMGDCPFGEVVPLGCGKGLALQIANPDLRLDPNKNLKVLAFESAPACDERGDEYQILVCNVAGLFDGAIENACLYSDERYKGNADPIFPISQIP